MLVKMKGNSSYTTRKHVC